MKTAFMAALVMVTVVTACSKDRVTGSGPVISETRTVNNFTGVATSGSTDITVHKGATFNVEVKGYSNLLPYLETIVINNVLHVRFKNHTNVRNDDTEVTVTMPALTRLAISGSANILSTGDFLNTNDFESRISGSGDITIQKGSAKTFRSDISGSGNVNASGFQVEGATAHISGSGNTHVNATANLNVEIAGSGNVYYKGSPSISASVSGSGKVQKQ